MKTRAEFFDHVASVMRPRVVALFNEAQGRRLSLWSLTRYWLLAGAAVVAAGMAFPSIADADLPPALIGFGIAALGLLRGAYLKWRRFTQLNNKARAQIKDEVVTPAVQFLLPKMGYTPDRGISRDTLDESRIFDHVPRSMRRFRGEDLFFGEVGETTLEFSELEFNWPLPFGKKSGFGQSTRSNYEKARGLFCVAEFNKSFKGTTLLRATFGQNLIGARGERIPEFGKSLLRGLTAVVEAQKKFDGLFNFATPMKDLRKITMEDPEFMRSFNVFCSDDVEAHYILTPALMKRLTEFTQRTADKVEIAFTQSRMYLLIYKVRHRTRAKFAVDRHDAFDIDLRADPHADETYARIYDDLDLMVGMVDALALNKRLWGDAFQAL